MNRVRGWLGFGLMVLMLTFNAAWAMRWPEDPPLTPSEKTKNLESFDFVWQTIRDKHWDAKLGGLNWDQVRDELRPKMEQAQTQAAARSVLQEMIGKLKQSHFGIMAGDALESMEQPKKPDDQKTQTNADSDDGDLGMDFRILEGKAIVTHVEKGTPAEVHGVKMGWEIEQVNDEAIAPLIDRISKSVKSMHGSYVVFRAVGNRLKGDVGSKVTIVFRPGAEPAVTRTMERIAPRGKKVKFGHLPTIYVRFEAEKLDSNIVYASLNTFFDPLMVIPKLEKIIKENQDAKGFILDLRGNPGGIGYLAVGIGGWFVEEENQRIGTMFTRDGTMHFVLNPRTPCFKGPLAILVDRESASTSEILAGGMQDIKRARIFGTATMGAALPSVITRLPNGDGFQYAFANYISARGQALEGRGVIPDQEVKLDQATLLKQRDPVLDAAVRWIQEQVKK